MVDDCFSVLRGYPDRSWFPSSWLFCLPFPQESWTEIQSEARLMLSNRLLTFLRMSELSPETAWVMKLTESARAAMV